jgi:hypothetical protein
MLTRQPRVGLVVGAALTTAAAVVWPSRAQAQRQIQLVPALGYYLPVGGWTQEADDPSGFPPLRRQLSALVFETRIEVWTSKRFVIQGTVAATPSQVAVSTATGTTDHNGGVFLASARAAMKLGTLVDGPAHDEVHWDLMLSGGLGIVHRSGVAWQNTSGVTAPTLLLGSDLVVGGFRLTVEDYVSWARFNGNFSTQTRARMHHDVIVSLGMAVRVAGPR